MGRRPAFLHPVVVCVVLCAGLLSGCKKTPPEPLPPDSPTTEFLRVPEGWAVPDMPDDNAFNDVRWALGRDLFFDPRLSLDGAVS